MDLITHVPGITNSAPFTPGVNTPAPWNVSHTGLTDGTSPNNATKNMAQIYNRLQLAHAAIIQDAGLTIDYANWTQITTAIRLLSTNHGGACPVTGPASPPSTASPFTRYTSVTPYFEEWEWFSSSWRVVANAYSVTTTYPDNNAAFQGSQTFGSFTCPRAGTLVASAFAQGFCTGVGAAFSIGIHLNGTYATAVEIPAANGAGYVSPGASAVIKVQAGDVITFDYWRFYVSSVIEQRTSIAYTS